MTEAESRFLEHIRSREYRIQEAWHKKQLKESIRWQEEQNDEEGLILTAQLGPNRARVAVVPIETRNGRVYDYDGMIFINGQFRFNCLVDRRYLAKKTPGREITPQYVESAVNLRETAAMLLARRITDAERMDLLRQMREES